MGAMQVFDFEENAIRVMMREGEPWFVAVDVCRALDLANPRDALSPLDEDERMTLCLTEGQNGMTVGLTDGQKNERGGARFLNLISEGGLYTLVLRCRDAIKSGTLPWRFRRWVTHEVIPSVRKYGRYETPEPECAVVENVATDDDSDMGPLQTIATKARLVELAERISGKASARTLWRELGLPALNDGSSIAPITEEYGQIARFVAEKLERVNGVVTPTVDLLEFYREWCNDNGIAPASDMLFFRRMPMFGFFKCVVRNGQYTGKRNGYRDVRLKVAQ